MKSMNSLLLASTALLAMTALSPTAHADVRLPGVLAQAAPPASGDADKKAPANADKKAPAGEAEKKKEPEKKEQKPAAAQQQQQAPKQAAPAAQQKPADAGAATAPAAQQPKSAQSAPDRAQRREERSEERQERRQERREERRERKDADSASPAAAEKKQTDKADKPEKADKANKAAADKAAADKAAADKAAADKAAADKAAADKAAADKAAADKADKTEKQESPASRSPAAQSKSPDAPDAKQPAPAARSTTQQPTQAAPGETTKPGSPQQPAARSAPQQSAPDAAKSANPTSPQQAAPGAAPSATPGAQQQGAAPSSAPAAQLAQPPAEPKDASAFIRRSDKEAAVGLDDLRRNRREFREGNRVVIQEGNRLIVREGDRTFIRHNALERFAVGARNVRVDRRRDGETVTIFTRPNGVTIVTVTDENGHMLRRVRRDRNGDEIVIFDTRASRGPVFVDLPPPRIRIPRERYILEAEHASPTEIYEVITAPPVEEIERHYTVEQVRYSDPLRDRMPRVDLAINFETGSWQLMPDQVDELSAVAKALNRALERNPREVFLIEGHTDAVGSDEDNLSLSDRRAETVAVALTEQFQVPPENLVTQGYGEQYLKAQTEGPSRENRHVSVRRITPLMAEQQAKSSR